MTTAPYSNAARHDGLGAKAAPAPALARDWQIDAAKALAIVLVVLGHANGMPAAYKLFAYSFHVPLFFVLSGWVGERFGHRAMTVSTIAKLARTLLVPYVAFFLVAYACWLLMGVTSRAAHPSHVLPWWDPFVGLFWANGTRLYVLPALWFLPALFVTTLAYIALRTRLTTAALAAASLLLALAWAGWFPSLHLRLPLALDVLPVALFFIAVGGWLSSYADALRALGASVWALALPVLAAAWWWLAGWNVQVDVNNLQFGHSAAVFLLVSLLGTAMTLCVAYFVRQWRWLQWIGGNTLLILCTHTLVFLVLTSVVARTGVIARSLIGTPAWAMGLSAFAVAVSVPMRAVLVRVAPWMLGLKRK
ncbi:acyltransferase family protein [Xanthomonas fragariae]|uniref:Xanthan biosynthesis acetyltransferase GumG n=1 Tax=Xanthomonas fragariae TaxID=48664 RepID=A0A1Y6HHB7_9XANT|nr:acyltransferase family protein [Xanthomonas fragariae]AOD14373.1 polysaccharide biosynthesis protein GumF [Xanthomonas fragariae]AOD17760.1 polysaccharide biosynthesis protein GumF [Xanthomonas fragariae]ENZ94659.1 exopolysaccharide xanthan biosynthesis acetyltransferase GumG [Xanthomonas fragariae LMG 25863]MDM7572483.1 acyltransferase family protein [Xanthomonas fragariae]MDM7581752.1 acyltransferase family protein [Xanthomonas fragariae]